MSMRGWTVGTSFSESLDPVVKQQPGAFTLDNWNLPSIAWNMPRALREGLDAREGLPGLAPDAEWEEPRGRQEASAPFSEGESRSLESCSCCSRTAVIAPHIQLSFLTPGSSHVTKCIDHPDLLTLGTARDGLSPQMTH